MKYRRRPPLLETLEPRLLLAANTFPTGRLDVLTTTRIAGWARDPDIAGPIRVNILIDNAPALSTLANTFRPDLLKALSGTGDYAFSLPVPETLAPGIHRFDLYAVDNLGKHAVLVGSRVINTNQLPSGHVDVLNAATIVGWALDPNDDLDQDSLQIRYTIDNNAPQFATASTLRTDLRPLFQSTEHGFSITLPALAAGSHTVSVDAVDFDNKVLIPLAKKTIVVTPPAGDHLPIGFIDIGSSTRIAGWAYDADVGPHPLQVRVEVDGSGSAPFTADTSRPDLVHLYGTDQLGFDLRNLTLTAGRHRIDLYAIDNDLAATPILIASKVINYAAPIGTVALFNATEVAGGAYLPADPNLHPQVRMDIDGMVGAAIPANFTSIPGSPNPDDHLFAFFIPLLPGVHQVSLWIIDPFTDVPLLFDTGKIVSLK